MLGELKEYYEIVNEACTPYIWIFPTDADFFYRNAFIIMKLDAIFI